MEKTVNYTDINFDSAIQQLADYCNAGVNSRLLFRGNSIQVVDQKQTNTNTDEQLVDLIQRIVENVQQRFSEGTLDPSIIGNLNSSLLRLDSELPNTYHQRISQYTQNILGLISESAPSGWRDYFSTILKGDMEHPSKMQKYAFSLDEMNESFRRQFGQDMRETYRNLKGEGISLLQTQLMKVLHVYVDPENQWAKDKRGQHYEFIMQLRAALTYAPIANEKPLFFSDFEDARKKTSGSRDPGFIMLMGICRARFEDCHLFSFTEEIVDLALQMEKEEKKEEVKSSVEQFTEAQEKMHSIPYGMASTRISQLGRKMPSHGILWSGTYDPHLQSNIPYVNFEIGDPQQPRFKFLRMGTPTIELNDWWGTVEINPEFLAYLCYKELMEEDYSYFNLQKPWAPEGNRVFALRGLQDAPSNSSFASKYLDNPLNHFKFFSFAQDTAFYHQLTSWGYERPSQSYKDFKQDYLIELFVTPFEQSGFYFPASIRSQPGFRNKIAGILDDVKQAAFPDKEELTAQDKRNFLEISYALIILMFMSKTCQISCKDAIDRAAKLNRIVNRIVQILSGNLNSDELKKIEEVISLAPALIVRKGKMEKKRAERLKPVLAILDQPEVQQRLARLAPKYGIQPTDVPFVRRNPRMKLEPPPKDS